MEFRLAYITTKDRAEAERIGRRLLEKKLAACVNIVDGMQSLYWWQERIEESNEAILIAKTTQAQVEALIAEVKRCHSYECPCVLSLPVTGGNPAYLAWLKENTGSP